MQLLDAVWQFSFTEFMSYSQTFGQTGDYPFVKNNFDEYS
jgi:hypothetical protein